VKLQALWIILGNACCPPLFGPIMNHIPENNDRRTEYIEEGVSKICKTITFVYIYIYIYIGVPGGMCQTSGECSLC